MNRVSNRTFVAVPNISKVSHLMLKEIAKYCFVVVLILLFPAGLSAQIAGRNVSKVGTAAATFLEIPVGARAIGLGGAFVGTANDITSLYWNPAGAARLTQNEVIFTHTDWIADLSFDYAGVGVPLGDFGTIGLSFTSLAMPDMPVRTVERPDGTGELFSAASMAIGLHYARNLSDRFSIGFTGKYISERIWNMQAAGFAIDVGALFTTRFFNEMRIGAIISNFGTDMKLSGRDTRTFHRIDQRKLGSNDRIPQHIELDSWPLPLNFQIGLAIDAVKLDDHLLTVELNALHPSSNSESLNLGVEYGFHNFLFVRGGYHSLFLVDSEGGLSLGAGVATELFGTGARVRLDYAFSDFGRLKGLNTLAVSVAF